MVSSENDKNRGGEKLKWIPYVRRSPRSPRPAGLSSGSAEIEQWGRPD